MCRRGTQGRPRSLFPDKTLDWASWKKAERVLTMPHGGGGAQAQPCFVCVPHMGTWRGRRGGSPQWRPPIYPHPRQPFYRISTTQNLAAFFIVNLYFCCKMCFSRFAFLNLIIINFSFCCCRKMIHFVRFFTLNPFLYSAKEGKKLPALETGPVPMSGAYQ